MSTGAKHLGWADLYADVSIVGSDGLLIRRSSPRQPVSLERVRERKPHRPVCDVLPGSLDHAFRYSDILMLSVSQTNRPVSLHRHRRLAT